MSNHSLDLGVVLINSDALYWHVRCYNGPQTCWALVNTVMNLRVPENAVEYMLEPVLDDEQRMIRRLK